MSKSKKYIKCHIHGFNLNEEIENVFLKIQNNIQILELNHDELKELNLIVKKKFLHSVYNDYKKKCEFKFGTNEFEINKNFLCEKLYGIILTELKQFENLNEKKNFLLKNNNDYLEIFVQHKKSIQFDFIIQLDKDGNKIYECHKLIFAFKSEYFFKLFENRQNIDQVFIKNASKTTFDFIYSYIYGFKAPFNPLNYINLYIAALVLEIEELKQSLEVFYNENIDNSWFKKTNKNIFLKHFLGNIPACKQNEINNEFNNSIKIHICDEKCIESQNKLL